MKPLTPSEYLAMGISEKLDALEARLDAASQKVRVDIRLDLLEVEMMLESIEATDRKYPRVKPENGGTN